MTGEKAPMPDPQPGNREPAPGGLALVQSFLNTHWNLRGDGTEVLVSGDALAGWLSARGLLPGRQALGAGDLGRALAVREGLRALAFHNGGRELDRAAVGEMQAASSGARALVGIGPAGPRFTADAEAGLDGAIGGLYAIVGRAMIDGSWQRLKACPGRDCGWAFYDQSRNQSARWCSMKVCGDREKSRAYYHRRSGF